MGPFFVFIHWGYGKIEMFDFTTKLEARAFYYGMREIIHRISQMEKMGEDCYDIDIIRGAVQRMLGDKAAEHYRFGCSNNLIQWMVVDLHDGLYEKNGLGHCTIYNDILARRHVEAKLDRFIKNSSI